LTSEIAKLEVATVQEKFCAWGQVKMDLLRQLMDDLLDPETDVIDSINEYLATERQLIIPETIGGYFHLTDMILAPLDDFIFLGATPTFVSPPMDPTDREQDEFETESTWKREVKE
jgi:hypothetical protein